MASGEQLKYPQANIAMGNGDLVQVQNLAVTLTSGAKQVHTLRRKGAGITQGTQESSVTFTSVIDEDGVERNYWRDVMKGTIRQLRIKVPGGAVLTLNGAFSQCDLDGPLDDATKVNCTFVGHMEDVDA